MSRSSFVPALGFGFLTRWYDPVLATFVPEARVRRLLVERLDLSPGQRVVDLGCGTATLLLAMQAACPGADLVGVDIDPRILALAARKLDAAGVSVALVQGDAVRTPLPSGTFDRVVSSLVLHHLAVSDHVPMLSHARSLLAPGGELHLIDWGPSRGWLPRAAAVIERLADGWGRTADSFEGRLPGLLRSAGFGSVVEVQRIQTRIGALNHYRATREETEAPVRFRAP